MCLCAAHEFARLRRNIRKYAYMRGNWRRLVVRIENQTAGLELRGRTGTSLGEIGMGHLTPVLL